MKVTVGNSVGMTISPKPYESIRVETTFMIEKDIKEGEEEALFEKVEKKIMEDLENKIRKVYKKQLDLKSSLNNY